jgi:hypothetical protein
MRRWFFDVNYHRWDKPKRRLNKAIALFLLIVVGAGGWLVYDATRISGEVGPSRPTTPVETAYTVPSDTFTTPYFEMKVAQSWEFIEKSSTRNKYVYHDVRNKLVQGFLEVYVNISPPLDRQQATRVLPATLGTNAFLSPESSVSDHCNKSAGAKKNVGEQQMVFKKIKLLCDNDATWYSVLVGKPGAGTTMDLKRPNGTTAQYTIFYQASSAKPESSKLIDLIRKFQVR